MHQDAQCDCCVVVHDADPVVPFALMLHARTGSLAAGANTAGGMDPYHNEEHQYEHQYGTRAKRPRTSAATGARYLEKETAMLR